MAYGPNNPYGSTFNYYQPGYGYGAKSPYTQTSPFGNSPIGQNYLEANRDASYGRWGSEMGFSDNTPIGDYFRAQRQKIFEGYGSALATNPDLLFYAKKPGFTTYLNQDLAGRIRQDFARLTPDQRGESFSRYAPRARQQMR
jgi:hypothetical protein